jgi:integrase
LLAIANSFYELKRTFILFAFLVPAASHVNATLLFEGWVLRRESLATAVATVQLARRVLVHQKARLTAKAYERESGIVDKHLTRFFAGPLASIRRVDIQRYVTKRAGDVSAHSVQKELNVLKHLLRLAVEWEIVPLSPAQGIKSPRVPAGRVRYLQPAELRNLLEMAPAWLRPIVALAATTGMRRSEILGLRWLDVDLVNARIMLPQTKNGDGRIVYLNQSAIAALRSLPVSAERRATDHTFSNITPEQVSVAFARLCRTLKIADFRFHDLRHTAASWLRMQGADIHTVAQLLGHKDLRMAARYQHLSPAFLADAVAGLDAVYALPEAAVAPSFAVDQFPAPLIPQQQCFSVFRQGNHARPVPSISPGQHP